MKKDKIILAIMVSIIGFSTFLSIIDAQMRVQSNYPYTYELNADYSSFSIRKKADDTSTLRNLQKLVSNQEVTILFENENNKTLGLYDTTNKYLPYPLFIGHYFSSEDFTAGNKSALRLVDSSSALHVTPTITINDTEVSVVGEYDENYVLYQEGATIIYSLFSLSDMTGTFYIDCEDTKLKDDILAVFRNNGYLLDVEKDHIHGMTVLHYLLKDRQFQMILMILLLTCIAFLVSDYALLIRRRKEYRVHYLVGTSLRSRIGSEIISTLLFYGIGILVSAVACASVMHWLYTDIHFALISYVLLSLLFLIFFTGLHTCLFLYVSKQGKKEG